MAFLLPLGPPLLPLFQVDVFNVLSILKSSRIVLSAHPSCMVTASTQVNCKQYATCLSSSPKAYYPFEHNRSLYRLRPLLLDGSTEAESPTSARTNTFFPSWRMIWGWRNPNCGTKSNFTRQTPQKLTHKYRNLKNLWATEIRDIVELVARKDSKLQNVEISSALIDVSRNTLSVQFRSENLPVMDSSTPAEPSQPSTVNDQPPPKNPTQPQSQPKKEKKPKQPKQPSASAALTLSPALIDLRVGHILRCIPHPNADSLYVSTIAMGDAEDAENTQKDEITGRIVRTVCSGLRGLIPLEEMQDRKVIVMANLKPVTMRGIKSAAMVLAASPPAKEGEDSHSLDRVVELVSPSEGSEGGDRVFFEGWEYGEGKGPEKVLNPKKKQWETVQPGLYTSEGLTVVFDAGRVEGMNGGGTGELVVEGREGKCTVKSLKGARLS